MAINSQLKRGTLELCVLALVNRGDCYGYELVNRISESMHITEGTIYPLLKRLKDNGSITSYIVESQEGPPRKYYRITDIGREEKQRQQQEWQEFSESIGKLINDEGEKPNV
jgi:PadR family transcriptional regulator PadR